MIDDIKSLDKFLKLCRKYNVLDISYKDIHIVFDKTQPMQPVQVEHDDIEEIETDELTDDQLLFYHINQEQ